mmetsp:Transcript_26486/g.37344  ORF Transcript_26486/g.37344 Transcript_26486/m.37344 type:complete len:189 (-) Transcript_26486:114-680(-)
MELSCTGWCRYLCYVAIGYTIIAYWFIWHAPYRFQCLSFRGARNSQVAANNDQVRPTQSNTQSVPETREERAQRSANIRQELSVKSWVLPPKTDEIRNDESSMSDSPNNNSDVETGGINTFTSISSETQTQCPICLNNFVQGRLVCESNNEKCCHLFHQECMVMWLLRHNECPCCRAIYLNDKPQTKP